MARKMNITIGDGIADDDALAMVLRVVVTGRISGNGTTYCYHTVYESSDGTQVDVCSDRTRAGNDTFNLYVKERGLDD